MKKIVLYDTAICTSNLGDEIILDSIRRNMSEILDNNFVLRLSTHSQNFNIYQMMRNGFKLDYFKNADLKFICGTNLIAQKRIGKINNQWQLPLSNIPINRDSILIGAGTVGRGKDLDILAKFLYKKALSTKYMHSVRDELTKSVVESVGVKAINTGCPTLWQLTPEFCKLIPRTKAKNCVLTVSGYLDQVNRENDQLLTDIVQASYNKVYAWIQTTTDEEYLDSLNNTENIIRIYSLKKYKDILQNDDVDYIGTRLHGGVYAMQNGVRAIIVSIDHRAEGFHEKNNIPIIDRKDISSKLENMLNDEFETKIVNDYKSINLFKNQF